MHDLKRMLPEVSVRERPPWTSAGHATEVHDIYGKATTSLGLYVTS